MAQREILLRLGRAVTSPGMSSRLRTEPDLDVFWRSELTAEHERTQTFSADMGREGIRRKLKGLRDIMVELFLSTLGRHRATHAGSRPFPFRGMSPAISVQV